MEEFCCKKNGFTSYLLYNRVINGDYPNYGIDHTNVLISSGTLTGALKPAENGICVITWENNSYVFTSQSTDKTIVFVIILLRIKLFTLWDRRCANRRFRKYSFLRMERQIMLCLSWLHI